MTFVFMGYNYLNTLKNISKFRKIQYSLDNKAQNGLVMTLLSSNSDGKTGEAYILTP